MNVVRVGCQFKFNGESFKEPEKQDISGVISMDGEYGRGYYQHTHEPGKRAKFGFMEVQLSYPDILVHAIIFDGSPNATNPHDRSVQHTDGYRWIKDAKGK